MRFIKRLIIIPPYPPLEKGGKTVVLNIIVIMNCHTRRQFLDYGWWGEHLTDTAAGTRLNAETPPARAGGVERHELRVR